MIVSKFEFKKILKKIIFIGLFFQLAVVPLLIDPFAFDFWYKPKIYSTYVLVLIILSAAVIVRIAGKIRITRPPFFLCFFLALYAISAIVSTIYSVDRMLSLQGDFFRQESVLTILVYAVLPVLFAALVFTRQQARMLLMGLLACLVLVAAYAIIQYAGFDPITTEPFFGIKPLSRIQAISSTLGNANFLGKFLVLTSPLSLAYLYVCAGWRKRLMGGMALVLAVAGLIVSETRASWLGFFIASGAFFFLVKDAGHRPKQVLLGILAGIICGGLVFVAVVALARGKLPDLQNTLINRTVVVFDVKKSLETSTRLYMWGKTIDCIARRPGFGFGPDTQVLVFRQFNPEYNRRFNDRVILDRAHNNYLDVALSQGLFGLFAYCGILISFLVLLWQTLKRRPYVTDRIFLCAIFSGYCGYLVNDFFSFSVVSVSPTFWSLIGLTISMCRLHDPASGPLDADKTP